MTKPTTLFQRWLARRRRSRAATEELYLNPLRARVGGTVVIDLPDWNDFNFEVISIRQVDRLIGDQKFPFTDYFLLARDLEGQEFHYGLRFIPLDQPDKQAGLTHQVLLFSTLMEHEYSEELDEALNRGQGVTYSLEGTDGRSIQESWITRVEGVEVPYDCTIHVLADRDHDGEVDRDEVEQDSLTLWDFERETEIDEAGMTEIDYLFVEIEDSGFTTYRHATEIDQMVVRYL